MIGFSFILFILLCASQGCAMDRFIAATYERAVILPENTLTLVIAEKALQLINRNIDILEKAIKSAASKGAHIIVTPEDGIYGWKFTREAIFPYLEDIPDPEVNWIPCSDPERFERAKVQTRLSCIAKNKFIYVLQILEIKSHATSSLLEAQKMVIIIIIQLLSLTLTTRYHKYNLFLGEIQFNVPPEPEMVTFETPFGKFGICFDILFYKPAAALVVDHQVGTILFPTAWMNLSAHPLNSSTFFTLNWSFYANSISKFSPGPNVFHGCLFFDEFTFTELIEPQGNHTLCQNNLCCHLTYIVMEKITDEVYVLGVFDGLHETEGQYNMQICTLLKCPNTDIKSWLEPVETASTKFK
ncbi:hypothetical protein XELAEV_18003500mg [Xenopus laevis]|nr:hypothetical protein XELAEV_18003500mg [Xenopus laevis]